MPKYNVPDGLAGLRGSGEFSDLKIVCGDKVFNAHRAIVATQSVFFAKLCSGAFKEAKEAVVELHDDEPRIVSLVLDYLYKFDYGDESPDENEDTELIDNTIAQLHLSGDGENSAPDGEEIQTGAEETNNTPTESNNEIFLRPAAALGAQLTNVAVYALAEKYIIPELKHLAVEKFRSRPINEWASADSIIEVLRAVYTTTPQSDRGLRNSLVTICVDHQEELQGEDFHRALFELPDARLDILQESLSGKEIALVQLRQALENSNAERDKLAEDNSRLEEENKVLVDRAKLADETGRARWKRLADHFTNFDACRHTACNAEFRLDFDSSESSYDRDIIIARCQVCQTRHRS